MKDPANPSIAEVRAWAYDSNSLWPMQDWDLIIWGDADPDLLDLFVELASDPGCPKRLFFLRCLYGRVGDEVRTSRFDEHTWTWVASAHGSDSLDVAQWAERSKQLRIRPELFDYEDWCGGRLASRGELWP